MSTLRAPASAYDEDAQKLVRDIVTQIETGELAAGDRLMSERQLAASCDVSLFAVRRAMKELKRRGLLVSQPRNGVFVADDATPDAPAESPARPAVITTATTTATAAPACEDESSSDGFRLLDVRTASHCALHFAIAAWDSHNRGDWEAVCRQFSVIDPTVRVEPHFLRQFDEYEQIRDKCDAQISTHAYAFKPDAPRCDHVSFKRSQLERIGVEPRYIDSVCAADGQAWGVPINACLMTGYLNRRLLSADAMQQAQQADNWLDLLDILSDAAAGRDEVVALNLLPVATLNPFHLLTLGSPGLFDRERGLFNAQDPQAYRLLTRAAELIERHGYGAKLQADGHVPGTPLAAVDFTFRAGVYGDTDEWLPWRFPLGANGAGLEAINVGAVNRHSSNKAAAQAFLLYLASAPAQQRLNRTRREYSVSKLLDDPFVAFAPAQAAILRQQREQAVLFAEWAPGFLHALESICYPAFVHWYRGHIDTDDLVEIVARHAQAVLDRHKTTPAPQPPGGPR